MHYWSTANIKIGKTILDQNRDHAPPNRTYPVVLLLHSQVSGKSIRVLTGAGGGESGRVVVEVWGCVTVVVAGGRVPPSSTTRVLKIPGFHLLSERMVQSHSRKSKTIYQWSFCISLVTFRTGKCEVFSPFIFQAQCHQRSACKAMHIISSANITSF